MSDSTTSPRDAHASGSHFQPSLSVVLIIVILFVGATFLMVRATSPSTSSTATTLPTSGTTTTTTPTAVVKSKVSVQVANGTTIPSLAAHYTQKLTTQNWDTLSPGNAIGAATHTAATIIYFHPGFLHAAREVASAIGVSASVVHPLGALKPVSGASSDDVIVVLGPNSKVK